MANSGGQQQSRGGLSLYANLLGSSNTTDASGGTISRAPVLFTQNASSDSPQEDYTAKKQPNAAALRFQPTKRPQLAASKTKPKPTFASAPASQLEHAATEVSRKPTTALPAAIAKSSLADWTGDDDDVNGFFADQKRQRGGRKKRKKGGKEDRPVVQDWDDIYDPSRPNTYEDYKNSEEKYREVREWKDRLYAHRFAKERRSSDSSSGSDGYRPDMNKSFAPPPEYSFAPPKSEKETRERDTGVNATTSGLPNDASDEDPYLHRLRMSQSLHVLDQHIENETAAVKQDIPPPPVAITVPPPPPPPPTPVEASQGVVPPPPPPDAGMIRQSNNTISRAPVRYQLPEAPSELPTSEAELAAAIQREEDTDADPSMEAEAEGEPDAPRSLRPGQKGFAQRLMSKYGWTKGSGLGADGSGIVAPLRVQIEKRKKRADADGGGFVGPAGKGKIIGSKRNEPASAAQEEGKFGPMSEVVVLRGMVDGMDLGAEVGDGGLMQEIGEECSDKYGRVERVFIDRDAEGSVPVFVKFTSQLSALRAVNALEGRVFSGNMIKAKFFDAEKFENGLYF